jgi:hypothetical protein
MIKKTAVTAALAMALVLAGAVGKAIGQEQEDVKAKAAAADEKSPHAYRLDFSVSEMEGGKKINARQYSMNMNGGDENQIKIGTRVPVEAKQGEFQYLDVGTSIWCRLRDRSDLVWLVNDVSLKIRTDISNFAVPEQQGQQVRPVLRQLSINASTLALVGKPVVVGSVDDPNSKRQFQLEVTVTKLR